MMALLIRFTFKPLMNKNLVSNSYKQEKKQCQSKEKKIKPQLFPEERRAIFSD